jgi:hypothetical protein
VVPIVEISHKPMPTKYNRLSEKPHFRIVGWRFPDGATELIGAPKGNNDMNDAIPF